MKVFYKRNIQEKINRVILEANAEQKLIDKIVLTRKEYEALKFTLESTHHITNFGDNGIRYRGVTLEVENF